MTFGCFVFDKLLFIGRHLQLYLGISSWEIVISLQLSLRFKIQKAICQQKKNKNKSTKEEDYRNFKEYFTEFLVVKWTRSQSGQIWFQ